ncbi:MAG: metallophosphoesterase [Planctomycetota bacterium]
MIRMLFLVFLASALLWGVRYSDSKGWIPADRERLPYLQQVAGDRAVVAWRTSQRHPSDARLEWGFEQDSGTGPIEWKKTTGESIPSNQNPSYCDHHVLLTGLPSGRKIRYRAFNDSHFIGEGQFRTDPGPDFDGPIRAWILGDSGTGSPVQYAVRDSMLGHLADLPLDMLVHVGDMAYSKGRDGEFTARFFRPYRSLLSSTPCWPAPGNHEMKRADSATQSGPYFEAFILPTEGECGGVASGTEAFYSFDYGPIHFISLDSSGDAIDPEGAMLAWLEEDLSATDQRWIIAFFHHPPYSRGSHPSNNFGDSRGRLVKMREVAVPVLEAGGVDLVLAGHSHVYERSALIQGVYGYGEPPSHPVTDRELLRSEGKILQWDGDTYHQMGSLGTVYSVVGNGGSEVNKAGVHPVMVSTRAINGSALLTIERDRLLFESVSITGEVIDQIVIDRSPQRFAND